MLSQTEMVVLINARLDLVFARIAAACRRAGRNPSAVEVMAVTKYATPEQIAALLASGKIKQVGENRVQPAMQRWQLPELAQGRTTATLHLIGHLQSNKAAKAVEFFDAVDSLDSLDTAQILGRKALECGKKLPVLVQIKLTGRETQSGASLAEAGKLAEAASKVEGLAVCGYMAIAPAAQAQELRPLFKQVKQLFDRDFPQPSVQGFKCHLSLGMTGDFETAVEEGATLPRIGSAIFAQQEDA